METDLNTPPQDPKPQYPEGYENWPQDDKEAFMNLKEKLAGAGVKIQIVEAQMGLAMFDEAEKTLRIRQDADVEFISDYVENSIFKEQEGVDQLPDPGELEDIHEEEDTEDGNEDDIEDQEAEEEITSTEPISIAPESVVEPVPSITPVENVEPTAVSQAEIRSNYVPEWQRGEEWVEFEKTRGERAKAEVEHKKMAGSKKLLTDALAFNLGKNVKDYRESRDLKSDMQFDYLYQKEIIAKKIEETFLKNVGENLTPEQQADLQSKINDKIFEELVKKENDAYLEALRNKRKETWGGKAMEGAKNLLGTKTMQWYLGLSRKQRMALSFGVGSIAGLAFGATVAPGAIGMASYLAWRAARVGLSGTAGAAAGEWANKKWSVEELENAKNREVEDLKNANLPLEEKTKGYEDIEKKYKKAKLKMTLKKMGTTIAAGAGTGLLTGLAEHAVMSGGGATKSALESKGGKAEGIAENRLAKKGFDPNPKPPLSKPAEAVMSEPEISVKKPEILTEPVVIETPKVLEMSDAPAPDVEVGPVEKIFDKPEILIHEVEAGDSVWKILGETLDNNEQFKGMTEAQKAYVLSSLTNKVLQNPENYGLGKGGSLNIGDKTDFTKLFEDPKEVNAIFEKAEQTVKVGSSQETSILQNNEKIATWVKAHPSEVLDEDKVTEILNTKPDLVTEPEVEIKPQPITEIPVPPKNLDSMRMSETPVPEPEALAPLAKPLVNVNEAQLHNEIVEAKNRLQTLEGARPKNPNLERTLMSDTNLNKQIETAFLSEVNSVYGKNGLLGIGKVSGINTKEWGEMARLPAGKVVEYYMGDSSKSGLAPEIVKKLSIHSHQTLMNQMAGLIEQSNGVVKPFDNENMEQFIKRLGGYVLKTHSQNLTKVA